MDEKIINNIKSLAIDMINKAGSGHPGISLGAATTLYTLYAYHLNASTSDPNWVNRDNFVLSAGHASALLYATLYMAGYNITENDLKNFRHANSKTPGHPEIEVTPGVDVSTGPLGQGVATSVGLALAEKMLKERTKVGNKSLIDHKVYVLVGDGDLMEGISYEALSLAGSLNLNNLVILYDSNNTTLDGSTESVFEENIKERFNSIGFNYELVKDGENIKAINKALSKTANQKRPTIIEIRTIIGNGSYLAGTNEVHGKPLSADDIKQLKYNLKIPNVEFYVDEIARSEFRRKFQERSNTKYQEWANIYREISNNQEYLNSIAYIFNKNIKCNFLSYDFKIDLKKESTRVTNRKVMNEISKFIPFLIGGTADVSSSTNASLEGMDVTKNNYSGKNIRYGVREHAMGAISNGLALANFRVFASTFLSFSDYLKPAIRMSALMKLPVIYIFSHDSILVGQDGPTHQPIEQLAMLRSIPNVKVYRPCDLNEIIGSWTSILNDNNTPSVLILSRTDVNQIPTSSKSKTTLGAYIIRKETKLDGIIIATGTEVETAILLAQLIEKETNYSLRVVSMPSMELFENQPIEYRNDVLPKHKHIFSLEASSYFGWDRYATHNLGYNKFGVSGTKDEVLKEMNFDFETLKNKIIEELRKG